MDAVVFETRSTGVSVGSTSFTLLGVAAFAFDGGVKALSLQSSFDYG